MYVNILPTATDRYSTAFFQHNICCYTH